jgi:HD superfamily phosphodiesterase
MKLEFSRQIFKNSQLLNFVKIRTVGFELFHSENVMYITYKIGSTEELSLEIIARMRTVK